MEKRELICIGCPMGCPLTVTMDQGNVTDVAGNTCPKGKAYAEKEVTNPTRIVTSTVRVEDGERMYTSVKTKEDIPKEKIMDIMDCIRSIQAQAPVHIGDVLLENAAGTGVNIIATKNIPSVAAPAEQ